MLTTSPDIQAYTKEFRRLQFQKHRTRGGAETRMLLDLCLYEGEHQTVQVQNTLLTRAFKGVKDKNRLNLMINLTRRAVDRKIGRLWSIAHEYRATPNTKDPLAMDDADLLSDQLIPATDFKAAQATLRWNLHLWQAVCGVVCEHVDYKDDGFSQEEMPKFDEASGELLWLDTLTGQELPKSQVEPLLLSGRFQAERFRPATEVRAEGDFGSDLYDPFRVFIEASCAQIKNLSPYQSIMLADLQPIQWIADTFGAEVAAQVKPVKDLSILSVQVLDRGIPISGLNLKDLLPKVQGSQSKDDPEMALVLTRYQPGNSQDPYGTRCFFVPDQAILDYAENPYPEIPVIDYHWSAPKSTFWTPSFVTDLHSMQKFINKRYSQLGEAANAQIYEMFLLGQGLEMKDIPTDFPGGVKDGIDENGNPKVMSVPRGNLPSFFTNSIELSHGTFDALSSSDLMGQRKMPTQMRGSLALPVFQEMLDSEDGPRFSHLSEQFAREKQMRINRIAAFYPPIRTMNYVGSDNRAEVLEFHAEKVLRAGVKFTVTIDPGSIFPEFSMMREARIRERLQWAPGLYTNPRTGTLDWSMVAKELKYKDKFAEGRASQGRKLARQLIRWCQQGKLVAIIGPPDPQTGKPSLKIQNTEDKSFFVVFPFWDHMAMMDEYESAMQTTEFLQASPLYRRVLMALHDQHRRILSQIDQARQNSIENKMVQGAVAQATQQAAAKAASAATDAAMEQVLAQQEAAGPGMRGLMQQIQQLLGSQQTPAAQVRRPMAPVGRPPMAPQPAVAQ